MNQPNIKPITSSNAPMLPFAKFSVRATQEMSRCDRYGRPFTLISARPPEWAPDLDGIPTQWLRSAAQGLTRSYDLIARSEREPAFLILLPETGQTDADSFLERLRSQIDDNASEWRFVTLEYPKDKLELRQMFKRAA